MTERDEKRLCLFRGYVCTRCASTVTPLDRIAGGVAQLIENHR
jgi:hypothetical protein